jgi:subtilisin family serine protease
MQGRVPIIRTSAGRKPEERLHVSITVTRALSFVLVAIAAVLLGVAATGSDPAPDAGDLTQVVVELASPPLGDADGPAAERRLDREHTAFEAALDRTIPTASVHWRYRLVRNGMSVVLRGGDLPLLERIPGIRHLSGATTYRATAGPDATTIRARELAGSTLAGAGEGIKIGIIDDGIDQRHPFFDPTGYVMPAGFPKGQQEYTTAKVIVARAFPPPRATWRHAAKPFDQAESSHGTHVAGIAAGNADTLAQGARISGIAPRAYIGNYKALTVPTDSGVGLDGNAPEIVAAIEAAVADGMDVINLSIGQPEIEPSRDIVALALDAAAEAGVVPVVVAGNDFDDYGAGSVISPGSSARAITVGATTSAASPAMADFSSAGPTPLSLRLKPDVVAPGESILSSEPGGWGRLSGTSMAAPHVAGAVALLLQRHADWSPNQVKAALTTTSRPVRGAGPSRAGAGLVDVAAADNPIVNPSPTSVSFGLVRAGATVPRGIVLEDAGGGAGAWSAAFEVAGAPAGTSVSVPAGISVPSVVKLVLTAGAAEGEVSGTIVLRRGEVQRRIPVWGRVTVSRLASSGARVLTRPGVYTGDTRRRPARVDAYRYPELGDEGTPTRRLAGPEQVFRVTIARPVANLGVVITQRGRGSRVEPRVVAADENRLTGYAALPVNLNPYVDELGDPVLVAGALRPAPGTYHVVFDSPTRAGAGSFRFRLWVNDVAPPEATFVSRTATAGEPLRLRVADDGAGVDPGSIEATLGGRAVSARLVGRELRVATRGLPAGRHRLRVALSDYQETRNDENVLRILPNTRVVSAWVTLR